MDGKITGINDEGRFFTIEDDGGTEYTVTFDDYHPVDGGDAIEKADWLKEDQPIDFEADDDTVTEFKVTVMTTQMVTRTTVKEEKGHKGKGNTRGRTAKGPQAKQIEEQEAEDVEEEYTYKYSPPDDEDDDTEATESLTYPSLIEKLRKRSAEQFNTIDTIVKSGCGYAKPMLGIDEVAVVCFYCRKNFSFLQKASGEQPTSRIPTLKCLNPECRKELDGDDGWYRAEYNSKKNLITFRELTWCCPNKITTEKSDSDSTPTTSEKPKGKGNQRRTATTASTTTSEKPQSKGNQSRTTTTVPTDNTTTVCGHVNPYYIPNKSGGLTITMWCRNPLCQAEKPNPFYYKEETDDETFQVNFVKVGGFLQASESEDLLKKLRAASADGKHTTVKAVLDQATSNVEEAKKARTSGQCTHCNNNGAKGCNHISLKVPLTFEQWYFLKEEKGELTERSKARYGELDYILSNLPACTCVGQPLKAIPRYPCNVFFWVTEEIDLNHHYWNENRSLAAQNRKDYTKTQLGIEEITLFEPVIKQTEKEKNMLCHVTPRSAGGCFRSGGNVIPLREMCYTCQCLDSLFTDWQGENTGLGPLEKYVNSHLDATTVEETRKKHNGWIEKTLAAVKSLTDKQ
jgi:hypothetical protein